MMKNINFYKTKDGKSPVAEFLNSLTGKQAQKVTWVLELIEQLETVPTTYLKKLTNTDGIWEVRAQVDGNIFRLLGFFEGNNLIILNHGFQKKSQKTPLAEIKTAQRRRKDHLSRIKVMSDLQQYITNRQADDPKFAENYHEGYQAFKFSVLLKEARKEAGLTQSDVAEKLHTQKSAISRIENHAEDVKLSTLERFAAALGKQLQIKLV